MRLRNPYTAPLIIQTFTHPGSLLVTPRPFRRGTAISTCPVDGLKQNLVPLMWTASCLVERTPTRVSVVQYRSFCQTIHSPRAEVGHITVRLLLSECTFHKTQKDKRSYLQPWRAKLFEHCALRLCSCQLFCYRMAKCRDCSVSIVTGLLAGQPRKSGSSPTTDNRIFSSPKHPYKVLGPPSILYT